VSKVPAPISATAAPSQETRSSNHKNTMANGLSQDSSRLSKGSGSSSSETWNDLNPF
jgi:hypothetical protein